MLIGKYIAFQHTGFMVLGGINFSVIIWNSNFCDHKMILLAIGGMCAQNESFNRVFPCCSLSFELSKINIVV